MEADEVYSTLNDKISDLQSKLDDNSSRFDALRSDLGDLKSAVVDMRSSLSNSGTGDLKSAVDRMQSDIQRLTDALGTTKSGIDTLQQANQKVLSDEEQYRQKFDAAYKQIDDANKKAADAAAAADRKLQDQQGLIGKLGSQAEDAAKTLTNLPDTVAGMARKAVDDGKKEILGIWESTKSDILGSISSLTTPLIKDAITTVKTEIKDEMKSVIYDQVKSMQDEERDKTPLVTRDELEDKIASLLKEIEARGAPR